MKNPLPTLFLFAAVAFAHADVTKITSVAEIGTVSGSGSFPVSDGGFSKPVVFSVGSNPNDFTQMLGQIFSLLKDQADFTGWESIDILATGAGVKSSPVQTLASAGAFDGQTLQHLAAVPEPGIIALLAVAFLIVLWRIRARQQQFSESTWESRRAERSQLGPLERVPRGQ